MPPKMFKSCLFATVIIGLFTQSLLVSSSWAQTSKLTWDRDVIKVKRVVKKYRKPNPRRKPVITAPLLTVQYRVIKRDDGGKFKDTSPSSVFYTGDQIKLAITPNQNGYLYIIHNTQGEDGQLIFPDSRINDGQNYIGKNREYIVPSYCPRFPNPNDCWYEMDEKVGREEFTLIFSRDAITSLPNQAVGAGGMIKESVIRELREDSRQNVDETSLPKGIGAGRYVIWVRNKNRNENEELIYTIGITHRSKQTN